MSEQAFGGYRCDACGMTFNSLSHLNAHTKAKHRTGKTTK
jgi:Zinc finger, C2H2 type